MASWAALSPAVQKLELVKYHAQQAAKQAAAPPPHLPVGLHPASGVPTVLSSGPEKTTSSGLSGPAFSPWTPFKPNLTPPAGFYDPSLDANLGSVQRGLGDTEQDTETNTSRLTSDLALGTDAINRTADRSMADLTTGRDRALADDATQLQQGTTDHATALANLARAYSQKANQQRQAESAGGVLSGGAAIQAAQKRAANQTRDQAPLDTNFQRLVDSVNTGEARTNENFATQSGRVGEDQQTQLGDLGLKTQRQLDDLTTQLTRSKREATAFGLDTQASKAAQSAANGWDPFAGRKSNEFGTGAGAHRVVVRGGIAYTIDRSGKIISKRKAG